MDFLLRLVLALLGWLVLLFITPVETMLRAPGFAILMTCLSVLLWEFVVAPRMGRHRRRATLRKPRRGPVYHPLSSFIEAPVAAPPPRGPARAAMSWPMSPGATSLPPRV
jgi:hypothetical protein